MTKHFRLNIFNLGNNSEMHQRDDFTAIYQLLALGRTGLFHREILKAFDLEFPDDKA